jgi:hypothetical protein
VAVRGWLTVPTPSASVRTYSMANPICCAIWYQACAFVASAGKLRMPKRTKDIRIICRPEVHGCPRIPALDQSTQGGPSGFDVNGGEFHRSNSLE